MTVNGGFGLMVQIPEATLQAAAQAYTEAQQQLFFLDLNRLVDLTGFGVTHTLLLMTQLARPVVRLVEPDAIDISLSLGAVARLQSRLLALPNGTAPAQPPELELSLLGSITIRVAGAFSTSAGRSHLNLDLRHLAVTSFTISIDSSNVSLPPRALQVLSAIIRRAAVYILSTKVGSIPVSWTIGANIPILGPINFPVEFQYRVVASGDHRALALLLRVFNEAVDPLGVRYALDAPHDVGVFLDLELVNYALGVLCRKLEGYTVADAGGIVGRIVVHDARMHVEPGSFVLDNIEVQSSTLQQITRTIEKLICTAIDPCNAWCEKVFETIIEWVQLDQLANARGRFSPFVDNGRLRVDASGISVNLSLPVALVVFTSAQALIPLGGLVSIILMIIGKVLADKAVEGMVEESAWGFVIDQPVPGTNRRAQAIARKVTWPDGTFALMTSFTLVRV